MPAHATSRIAADSGVAMVEMALVLPIFLVLLMGILDFGRAINYWNDANQIAADGARFAAVNSNPGAPALTFGQWLRGQADTGELFDGSASVVKKLEVCIDYPQGQEVGKPVEVSAEAEYGLLPIVDTDDDPTVVLIRGSATMRLEVVPADPALRIPAGCTTT
jgi:hypothetical protein